MVLPTPARAMTLGAALGWLAACAPTPSDAPAEASPPPPAAVEWLTDVSSKAGVDFVHVHGGSGQRYMNETLGSGGGFWDFDNDGWLDLYLVQSGPTPGFTDPSPRVDGIDRVNKVDRVDKIDRVNEIDRVNKVDRVDQIYRNRGDGTFENVTARVGDGGSGYGMGACFGDVDNDGFIDVYLTNFGPDRLLRNDRGQRLIEVAEAGIDNPVWSASCAFADYDRDGCLDLYVVNYVDFSYDNHRRCTQGDLHMYCHPDVYNGVGDVLYRNRCRADGPIFEDVTERAGVHNPDPAASKGLGVVWSDVDDDGDVDLYVANDSTANFLYRNQGDGTFREVGALSGTAFNDRGLTEAGMGTDAGDVDGDGRFDLFVAHLDFETNTLYRNQGRGLFLDATAQAALAAPSMRRVGFGVNLFDVDDDGDLDLFVANGHILDNIAEHDPSLSFGQPDQLFVNGGDGRFEVAGTIAGAHFERAWVGRGSAVGDVDNDGDLDLWVANCNQPTVLLRNRIGDRSPSLTVRLVSRYGGRDAIGARGRLVTAEGTLVEEVRSGSSYLSQGDLRLHFGLGSASNRAERLEIRWPEGDEQVVDGADLEIDAVNVIRQEAL